MKPVLVSPTRSNTISLSLLSSSEMVLNQEALLLLLDVSPPMHRFLPEVEKLCSMLLQKKLSVTQNELTKKVGGCKHVLVSRNIKVVDGDVVESLRQLPRGTFAGDFLDAIVVGMDMMIKKFPSTKSGKIKKRLCLITSTLCPTKGPCEGSKEDEVGTIADQMTAHGMRLECIVARRELSGNMNMRIMEENDLLLELFSKKTIAKIVHVESPTSLLGALRTQNIMPVTVFRGDLELSPIMAIKVWVYKKAAEERFPTVKLYSDKAPPTDKFATHEVKMQLEYKSIEDSSKVVPPEQRIKGYSYGPQFVPFSSAEWEAVKFQPEKGVKLLGFIDASNIMRHYYKKDVNIFIAKPGNTKAILAVSALARAMKEMNRAAILRCVWRQRQKNVIVGILTPNVSEKDSVLDSFYFNVLPYAEDVQEFQFPSFSKLPLSWQPNEEQQEAADNLVKMLDLAPFGKKEALLPDLTPNPVLERFYRYLELKLKKPYAAVPPVDKTLKMITEPDPKLLAQNKSIIDEFKRRFVLKDNPKMKKPARDELSGVKEEAIIGERSDVRAMHSIENRFTVEKIGDLTPVEDFEAMMSHTENTELVDEAIKEMKNKIFDLVQTSNERDNHLKALDCLAVFRKSCLLEQEPREFNNFVLHIYKFCKYHNLNSFCESLASKEIMLITNHEVTDSEVTEDEARSFMVKKEPMLEYTK